MKKFILVLAVSLMSSGCVTVSIPPKYTSSPEIQASLSKYKQASVSIGKGTPSAPWWVCHDTQSVAFRKDPRVQDFTFTNYLNIALEDELKQSGIYDPNSPVELNISILKSAVAYERKSYSSWIFSVEFASSNGNKLVVTEYYKIRNMGQPSEICPQLSNALVPVTQNIVKKAVQDQRFKSLISPTLKQVSCK